MGFFTDLKEDLSQAVNELMPDEKLKEKKPAETLDEMLDRLDLVQLQEEIEESLEEEPAVQMNEESAIKTADIESPDKTEDTAGNEESSETVYTAGNEKPSKTVYTAGNEESSETGDTAGNEKPSETVYMEPAISTAALESIFAGGTDSADTTVQAEQEAEKEETVDLGSMPDINIKEEPKQEVMEERHSKEDRTIMNESNLSGQVLDETAVITTGMVITGDMISRGSVDVMGSINGSVDILGKLNVTGYITGNSKAAEIFADGAKINGEVVSEGSVKVGASSVIVGNITATSAVIAGAVKGDIDVQGPVILDTSAIVMGNIKSKSVQINNGAVIEGMCSQCYAEVNPTSFFEDYTKDMKNSKKK